MLERQKRALMKVEWRAQEIAYTGVYAKVKQKSAKDCFKLP